MGRSFLYFLQCSDGTIYTGTTTNLELRLQQHFLGEGSAYTRNRLPVTLLHVLEFDALEEAARAERQVKRWSKGKKLALIRGDFDGLRELAKCQNDSIARNRP